MDVQLRSPARISPRSDDTEDEGGKVGQHRLTTLLGHSGSVRSRGTYPALTDWGHTRRSPRSQVTGHKHTSVVDTTTRSHNFTARLSEHDWRVCGARLGPPPPLTFLPYFPSAVAPRATLYINGTFPSLVFPPTRQNMYCLQISRGVFISAPINCEVYISCFPPVQTSSSTTSTHIL
ncbi:hypothetical protein J6590_047560 [Homalodisca vitripennis]|nr:hypothetical protein J6590_047560 [Homalodisca vitripennis]